MLQYYIIIYYIVFWVVVLADLHSKGGGLAWSMKNKKRTKSKDLDSKN